MGDKIDRGEQLQAQVEAGIAELEYQLSQGHTKDFLELLEFYGRFRRYSISNTKLIKSQMPHATHVAGYRKWEAMGYQVRRGERAIYVRGPRLKKYVDPDTGEITQRLIGYLALPVFDVSQLEGNPELPGVTHDLEGDFDYHYAMALAAITRAGIAVEEAPLPLGVHGASQGGRIFINERDSLSDKFLTILHELGHEVLHHNPDEKISRRQGELEAEAISFLLARFYGLDNPFSRDYITSFHGTVEGLHESFTRIHNAVKRCCELLMLEPAAAAA